MKLTTDKQTSPTPLAVMVAATGGGLAQVTLRADPDGGWSARLDDYTFYVSRVRTGPASPPAWEE